MNEENCARLIRMGMGLGDLGGCVLVDEGYSDEEIRVANETVKRAKGPKFAVMRGKIHLDTIPSHFRAGPSTIRRMP